MATYLQQAQAAADSAFRAGNHAALRILQEAIEHFDAARAFRTMHHGESFARASSEHRKGKAAWRRYLLSRNNPEHPNENA